MPLLTFKLLHIIQMHLRLLTARMLALPAPARIINHLKQCCPKAPPPLRQQQQRQLLSPRHLPLMQIHLIPTKMRATQLNLAANRYVQQILFTKAIGRIDRSLTDIMFNNLVPIFLLTVPNPFSYVPG